MLKCLQNLLVQELICLIEVLTSLGMSDDDPLAARIDKHVRGNLTGEGSLLLDIHILSADRDVRPLHSLDNRDNINCRYAVNNIGVSSGNKRLQGLHQSLRLGRSHVHLPVAGNNLLSSHGFLISFYFNQMSFASNDLLLITLHRQQRQRPGGPSPPGTQGKLLRRWRYASSCCHSQAG